MSKLIGFNVSKFLGLNRFWLLGFLVSRCLGFKVSKIYQIPISCFLEDIDLVSKIFKTLLDRSSGFFGACLFDLPFSIYNK